MIILIALVVIAACAFGLGMLAEYGHPRAAALGALALLVLAPAVVAAITPGGAL